ARPTPACRGATSTSGPRPAWGTPGGAACTPCARSSSAAGSRPSRTGATAPPATAAAPPGSGSSPAARPPAASPGRSAPAPAGGPGLLEGPVLSAPPSPLPSALPDDGALAARCAALPALGVAVTEPAADAVVSGVVQVRAELQGDADCLSSLVLLVMEAVP